MASGTSDLFLEGNTVLATYVARFWSQILANKTIDVVSKSKATSAKTWVDLESIKHTQVREVGAEYIGHQTLNRLHLNELLTNLDWSQEKIQLSYT